MKPLLSGFFFLPSQMNRENNLGILPKPVDMRRSLLVLIMLCFGYALQAQKQMSIKIKDPVVCYAGTEDHPHYIAAPDEYLRKSGRANKANATNATVIEVTYLGFEGVPQAQAAFQRAVDIWASILVTSMPIRIEARWVPLASGVLGSANYTAAYANFKGAQRLNVFYPVAIAEKITGTELNSNQPDLFANFNSNFDWHYDPDDPAIPSGKYDLTTVVLHEIGHGLGFSGTFTISGSQGSYGLLGTGVPIVYDAFLQTDLEENLIETFESPSTSLNTQLTSAALFFNGHSGVSKIYAPPTFNGGSSISHLDEFTFNNTPNALMTPQIASQERIRNPGIARNILNDLGWEMVYIDHVALPHQEDVNGPYPITATLGADNGYDQASVTLHYTLNGTSFTDVPMTHQGNNVFTANIPGNGIARQYGYYISAKNNDGATYVNPGIIVRVQQPQIQNINVFATGPDTENPIITHTKKLYLLDTETELVINAEISDNIGSLETVLEYSINGGAQQSMALTLTAPEEDSIYTATIHFSGLVNGDEIKYRIVATDNSSNHNQSVSPKEDKYTVPIIGFGEPQTMYSNTFSDPELDLDFFGEGFSITTPDGFTSRAIHSEHPYITGNDFENNERNIIYQLRIPIVVANSAATIKFDEIALVEPGNPGSVFGDSDFFDYVIVEGSADEGETWEYLLPGYDARSINAWLTRYNSAVDAEGNSTATGNPQLYRSREINMLQTFDAGTEILIRFRMYIDQLAVGWGWTIDNLAIQTVITGTEQALDAGLHLYPNPATNQIQIELDSPTSGQYTIELLSLQGQKLYLANARAVGNKLVHTIAASQLAGGMYVVKISNGSTSAVRKIIKTD